MEAAVFREGNPVHRRRDEGAGKARLVAVKVPFGRRRGRVVRQRGGRIGSRLRVGDPKARRGRLGRGFSFRGGNGIA